MGVIILSSFMEALSYIQGHISGNHIIYPTRHLHPFLDFLTGPAPGVREVCAAAVFCRSIHYGDFTNEIAEFIADSFDDGVDSGKGNLPFLISIDIDNENAGRKGFSRSGFFRCLLNASAEVSIVLYLSVIICSQKSESERQHWITTAHSLINMLVSRDILGQADINEDFRTRLQMIPHFKLTTGIIDKLIWEL